MSWSIVQAKYITTTPNSTQAGSLLILTCADTNNDASISDNQGNVWSKLAPTQYNSSTGWSYLNVFYCFPAVAGVTSITLHGTNVNANTQFIEISGISGLDASNSNTNQTTSTYVNLTTTQSGDLLLEFVYGAYSKGPLKDSQSNTYTDISGCGTTYFYIGSATWASSGTLQMDPGSSGGSVVFAAAFKVAAGGGGGATSHLLALTGVGS